MFSSRFRQDEEGSYYSQEEDNVDGDDGAGQGGGGYDSAGVSAAPGDAYPGLQLSWLMLGFQRGIYREEQTLRVPGEGGGGAW